MTVLSKALEFAEGMHARDKKNHVPFLYHPLAVASLVLKYGGTSEQMIAAILHDTITYENVTENKLSELFGRKIAEYTYTFSDPPLSKDADWRTTKQAYLNKVSSLSEDKLLLVACEELHEIEELLHGLKYEGVKVWERFPVHGMEVTWYFRELFAVLYDKLKSKPTLVSEFSKHMRILKELVFEGKS